jgi:pimeloyl-ACP methyl ester carboxylesterase
MTPTATTSSVSSRDGTRIGWTSLGGGDPVLLVHGGGADHKRLEPFGHLLTDRFSVHLVDRRGRGMSGDGIDYAVDREYDDIAAVAEAVGGGVTVVGHSYGGPVVIGAATRTSAIERVVAYEGWPSPEGSPPSYDPGDAPDRIEALVDAGDRDGAIALMFRELVGLSDPEIDWIRNEPSWASRIAAADVLPREIRTEPTITMSTADLGSITAPVLFVIGQQNEPALRPMVDRLCSIVRDGRVAVLPGQGHMAFDTAPDLLTAAINKFKEETS